jgi:RNA polymerase sigma-70 factor (ECF subfamily)
MTMELTAPWTATEATPPEDVSDTELVVRAQEGDTEAFSVLVERHQNLVFNLSYRFMRDPTLAEDAAQEAFLKAFRLLRGFRGDCNFSTWMYRVTVSVCLTEIGRRKKRQEVELQPMAARQVQEADRRVESSDVLDMIRRCVNLLPGRYASIITLYYLKEIPYEEIARVMRIPMGTLKTWMFRARSQLRSIVEKEFDIHGVV